jgi:hypothetical protein
LEECRFALCNYNSRFFFFFPADPILNVGAGLKLSLFYYRIALDEMSGNIEADQQTSVGQGGSLLLNQEDQLLLEVVARHKVTKWSQVA